MLSPWKRISLAFWIKTVYICCGLNNDSQRLNKTGVEIWLIQCVAYLSIVKLNILKTKKLIIQNTKMQTSAWIMSVIHKIQWIIKTLFINLVIKQTLFVQIIKTYRNLDQLKLKKLTCVIKLVMPLCKTESCDKTIYIIGNCYLMQKNMMNLKIESINS